MLLASECGRSHALSALSTFRSKFQLLVQRRSSAACVSILSLSAPVEFSRHAGASSQIHERKVLFNRACCPTQRSAVSTLHGVHCSVLYMNGLNPLQI
uniref:Uncharacterized protein n=1 Tax=Setaria italica TaxID=4555 RepID=K3Y4G2_SETIT